MTNIPISVDQQIQEFVETRSYNHNIDDIAEIARGSFIEDLQFLVEQALTTHTASIQAELDEAKARVEAARSDREAYWKAHIEKAKRVTELEEHIDKVLMVQIKDALQSLSHRDKWCAHYAKRYREAQAKIKAMEPVVTASLDLNGLMENWALVHPKQHAFKSACDKYSKELEK